MIVPSLLAALIGVGCAGSGGSSPGAPAPGACAPVDAELPAGATLADGAGRYRLAMVAEDGSRAANGVLVLEARPEGMRERDGTATPLSGTVDVDLGAVGAQIVRDLASDDPSAPGVLVLERMDDGAPSILLRLGSEANDADRQAIDGAYTVLEAHLVTETGVFGSWRSGVRMERSDGYFCAWRDAD